ncbi:hypothetical protein ACRPFF_11575, partial [Neisseria sp. SLRRB23]|uniref:hypothetical protein n=1 Tax=Neisseria sp. SLRRB23 TaxID=3435199 RepID=UPI003D7FD2DC
GIRDDVESRGLGDVYKRQIRHRIEDVISEEQKLSYAGRPSSASPANITPATALFPRCKSWRRCKS